MKKNFFYGALAVLSLTACSQDEVVDVNRNGDEIKFSVVTNKATRAEDVYSNTNKLTSFNVWASHNNATYINGDEIRNVSTTGGEEWKNQDGNRYWPNEGNVNFYAANAGTTNWSLTETPTIDFTVADNVDEQEDLLYAVTLGQNKTANANGVAMNFRHALSQIVFKAKNTNPNLYVEIYGVTVCNLHKTNTYTYPIVGTGTNFTEVEGDGSVADENNTNLGDWASLEGYGTQDYNISWNEAIAVVGNKTNPVVQSLNGDVTTSMLLLPQATTAWDPATETDLTTANGTYFLVKCNMYNVKGDAYEDGDILVWGKEGEGKDVAIPVQLTWEQGNKYIYTFVFSDANGGYDPENPDQPAMTPITFTVTVDDFDNVQTDPVEVKK